jgi:diguanylate cyclase (GGDEF)-like protein
LLVHESPVAPDGILAELASPHLIAGGALSIGTVGTFRDAIDWLERHTDMAVVVLDLVPQAAAMALNFIQTLRDVLNMRDVRIIVRHSDGFDQKVVAEMLAYDIHDCLNFSSGSPGGLKDAVANALRYHRQNLAINASWHGMNQIAAANAALLRAEGINDFARIAITKLCTILDLPHQGIACSAPHDNPLAMQIIAATGIYAHCAKRAMAFLGAPAIAALLAGAVQKRSDVQEADSMVVFIPGQSDQDLAIYLDLKRALTPLQTYLLGVLRFNMALAMDNVLMVANLTDRAYKDPLLRIPNRTAFMQQTSQVLPGSRNAETVALLNIDRFSEINNSLGHKFGDELLKTVVACLGEHLPKEAVVARISSNTLGILGPSSSVNPETLMFPFKQPYEILGRSHHISVTIGLAHIAELRNADIDVTNAAGIALERAKSSGHNRYCYFTQEMQTQAHYQVTLLQQLHATVAQSQQIIVYQPQVNLATRQIVGVEALLRCRTPDGRLIPPDQFIPLAESSGLIVQLGEWALRTACQEVKQWEQLGIHAVRMSVNVSVAQFRQPDFLSHIDDIVRECDISPHLLELEITESMAMLDTDFMIGLLDQIRERGIAIAVDDFGTGFSSLSYLQRLNVNRLKIDRSFVTGMLDNKGSQRIIDMIVRLGRSLDLGVIAEGVEHEAEAEALRRCGVHEAQGYLFSPALFAADLVHVLRAQEAAKRPPEAGDDRQNPFVYGAA